MPASIKRMDAKHLMEIDELLQTDLLNTIRIPKNLHFLTERLPKANYTPMKIKKVDKHKFLQTLAGYKDPSLNLSLLEDIMKVGSESVDSRQKHFKEPKNLGNIHLPPLQAYGEINNSNKENNEILKIYAVNNEKGKERHRIHSLNKGKVVENRDKIIQLDKNTDQSILKLDIRRIEEKEKEKVKSPEKIKKDKERENSSINGNNGSVVHENGKEFILEKQMVNIKNIYGSNSTKKLNELSIIKGNHAFLNEHIIIHSKKLKKLEHKNHDEYFQ